MPNTVFGRTDLSAFTHNQGIQPAGCTTQHCAPEHLGCEHKKAPGRSARGFLVLAPQMLWCAMLSRATSWLDALVVGESAQISATKDSIGHVEVFQMDGVGTPIIGRPRPLPGHNTPNPERHSHALNFEEPDTHHHSQWA